MSATDIARQVGEGCRTIPLAGHVGFDSLPDQLVNKSISQGFCFNILCVDLMILDTIQEASEEPAEPAMHTFWGQLLGTAGKEL
ncbi:hypothetical protein MC885_006897 [Smutsia gigantea]|nr:hypothetical protein MC885_006897 [Smutsia gigantea]